MHHDLLDHEDAYFQYGSPSETYFNWIKTTGTTAPSLYINYPRATKIISFHIYANDHIRVVGREIYGVLDFLGDVGGLYGIIFDIGSIFIGVFSMAKLNAALAKKLYTTKYGYLSGKGNSDTKNGSSRRRNSLASVI